jgi:hypothetical protein
LPKRGVGGDFLFSSHSLTASIIYSVSGLGINVSPVTAKRCHANSQYPITCSIGLWSVVIWRYQSWIRKTSSSETFRVFLVNSSSLLIFTLCITNFSITDFLG